MVDGDSGIASRGRSGMITNGSTVAGAGGSRMEDTARLVRQSSSPEQGPPATMSSLDGSNLMMNSNLALLASGLGDLHAVGSKPHTQQLALVANGISAELLQRYQHAASVVRILAGPQHHEGPSMEMLDLSRNLYSSETSSSTLYIPVIDTISKYSSIGLIK